MLKMRWNSGAQEKHSGTKQENQANCPIHNSICFHINVIGEASE